MQSFFTKANQVWSSMSPQAQKYTAIAAVILVLGVVGRAPSSSSPKAQTVSASPKQVLLSTVEPGYSILLRDDGCVVLSGLTEGHLRQMGTDLGGLKASIKSRGVKCVLVQ